MNQGASDFGTPGPNSPMDRRIADRKLSEQTREAIERGTEQAKRGELTDGPNLNRREASEDRRQDTRRVDDVAKQVVQTVVTSDLQEVRALAATIRQCQRNGHPDLSKHLEALLTKLGA